MPKKPVTPAPIRPMNIIKKIVSIALLVIMLDITGAAQADASVFSSKNTDASPADTQTWSFDSLYQTISGFSLNQNAPSVSDSNSVTPVSNPAVNMSKPKTKNKQVYVSVSAYSSTPDQTDSSPFITASGTYVRDGIVAANFLPIGTAIKIPDLFGNKVFVVEDRMNSRYWYNVDIWFATRDTAKQFGRKTVKIEIIS